MLLLKNLYWLLSLLKVKDVLTSLPSMIWPFFSCQLHPHYFLHLLCPAGAPRVTLESSHSPAALHHPQVTPVLQSLAIWTACSHFPGLHLNFSWSLHTGRPLRSPRRLSLCDTRLHFNCSLSSCYAVIPFSELWHIDYCVSRTIRCYRHIDSPVIFPETTSRKIQLPSTDFFGMLVSILKLRIEFF